MAATSSLGSNIFAIVSLLVIAVLVLFLIRHYLPLRSTPAYLFVPVFLALALPCSIILLVPIDLASAPGNDTKHVRGIWLPERALLVTWRITYWLTFMLTWFLLPFLGEYCDSGYRDVKSRTIYSLRTNARYQLIMLSTGVAGLVYLSLDYGFHFDSIKGLVMALAYAWGLILAIALMGHGLVALPKRLWKNATVSDRLRRLQTQAPKIKERLDEANEALEKLELTVIQLKRYKGGASREQQEWIDELSDTSSLPDSRSGLNAAIQATTSSIPAVVTDRYLADLTRKVKRARHRKARFLDEWNQLCEQAQDAQTTIDAATSKRLDFGRHQWKIIPPALRYQVYANIVPVARKSLAVILAIASTMIVWSEIVTSFAPKLSFIGLTIVHHPNAEPGGKISFSGQLIAAAWLLYMDASTLYAISDVKVWGNRALVKRQTYAESACWYSLQVAKLTVPLSYNFVTMIPKSVYQETMFFQFLGKLINLTHLGRGFSTFFPCVLLIPFLATLFNLYGKMKNILGFGVLEDDSEDNPSGFGTGGWREGRALIERELQQQSVGATSLGLESRGASLDLENGRPQRTAEPRAPLPQERNSIREANRQFNAITNEEEPPDDSARHFYQDFTERVRNTFDTADTPEWIKNVGSAFKAPKWMSNDSRDSPGGPGAALSRWFGGRQEDGRVRL